MYGSIEGALFPTVTAGSRRRTSRRPTTAGRAGEERTQYGPSLSLGYTVLDFGGRAGTIDVARQTAIAADLTHNATVENTILQVEAAAFSYLSTRSQRDAQKSRRRSGDRPRSTRPTSGIDVGLATIADVLQAQTARSQAELQLETLEGALQITRGSLAVAMGVPANTAFDIPGGPGADSVHFVAESVDSLIDLAVRNRPELATARAQAAAAASAIRVARSAVLPALGPQRRPARTTAPTSPTSAGETYSLNIGVQIPVFTGFSNQYDVQAASEDYQSALARARRDEAAGDPAGVHGVLHACAPRRTACARRATCSPARRSRRPWRASDTARASVASSTCSIAQSALASARAQEVDARWQWRTALAQLAHDVGVLNARGDTTFTDLTPAPDGGRDR